jgi:hypothetical protein
MSKRKRRIRIAVLDLIEDSKERFSSSHVDWDDPLSDELNRGWAEHYRKVRSYGKAREK